MHKEKSELAGKEVTVKATGQTYRVEDWWDRVAGKSWQVCDGNPACIIYAVRSIGIPMDDEVLYGKIGAFGSLMHITELEVK